MRRIIISVLLLLSCYLAAQSGAYSFLSSEEQNTLEQGEPLYFTQSQASSALYYPRSEHSQDMLLQLSAVEQDIITEVLFFQPYQWGDKDIDMVNLSNRFLQVSEQEGILYFSHRKQDWVELIEESYTLESENSRRRIDDISLDALPAEVDFWCFQKDAIFGGNYFQYHISSSAEIIEISFQNQSPMRVMGLLTAFDEGDLNARFFLTPSEDGFYCYAIAYIENLRPMVERNVDVGSAFRKRIEAVLRWFMEDLP